MRELITRNLHLKVIAFTLTLTLYSFVLAESEMTQTYTLQPEVASMPSDHVLLRELPPITVELRGSRRGFARLDPDALRTLPITITNTTQTQHSIRESDLRLPSHLEVLSIRPSRLPIDMERLVERILPVRENRRGNPAPGFELTEIRIEPNTALITAPVSYFDDLRVAFTETIDLGGATGTLREEVGLAFQRPYVDYGEQRFILTAVVEAQVGERTLEAVPIQLTGDTTRCALSHESLELRVTGPVSVVDGLEPSVILAVTSCPDALLLGAGTHTFAPTISNLPRSVEIAEQIPETVLVTVAALPEISPATPLETEGSGTLP
ncbi:MAG: hypothetical protein ACJA1R_002104, partial [Flavobacteriales bacterium]